MQEQYVKKRTRETFIISSLILTTRVISIVALIIYASAKHTPNILSKHLYINLASLVWHLLVIICAKKFPKQMISLHSPLIMLSFFFIMGQNLSANTPSTIGGAPTVLNMTFYLISGLLLNSNWLFTSFAILANSISTLYYLIVLASLTDPHSMVLMGLFTLFFCYACYYQESVLKSEMIRYSQIEQINEDFKCILMDMPKSIIIFDSKTKKVHLANNEC